MLDNVDLSQEEPLLPKIWKAGEIDPPKQTRWLARNRLPFGHMSMLVGDEGIGKSLFWVWLSGFVTTGKPFEAFGIPEREPLEVVLVTTEDGAADEIKPRLQLAGVNFDYVSWFTFDSAASEGPTFPAHIDELVKGLSQIQAQGRGIGLIVVDAWADTLPAGLRLADPAQARIALKPWRKIVEQFNCALLLITHTNKANSRNARDNYGLTGELRKKVRMALFAQQNDEGNLIIGPEKSNSTKIVNASVFAIESRQFWESKEDDDGTKPKLVYLGEYEKTAGQLIIEKAEFAQDGSTAEAFTDAKIWLDDFLVTNPGTQKREIVKAARAVGHSERTLERAAKELGVVSKREGFPRVATWYPPRWDDDPLNYSLVPSSAKVASSDKQNRGFGGTVGGTVETANDYGKRDKENSNNSSSASSAKVYNQQGENGTPSNTLAGLAELAELETTRGNTPSIVPPSAGGTVNTGGTEDPKPHVCFDCKKPIDPDRRRCVECSKKLAEKEGRA